MSEELAKQFIEIMFAEENADIDAWMYALKQNPEVRQWASETMDASRYIFDPTNAEVKHVEPRLQGVSNEKQNLYQWRVHHDGVVLCVTCPVHLLGAVFSVTIWQVCHEVNKGER